MKFTARKRYGVAAAARADIEQATGTFLAPQVIADGDERKCDTFAGLKSEDKDKLDANEV